MKTKFCGDNFKPTPRTQLPRSRSPQLTQPPTSPQRTQPQKNNQRTQLPRSRSPQLTQPPTSLQSTQPPNNNQRTQRPKGLNPPQPTEPRPSSEICTPASNEMETDSPTPETDADDPQEASPCDRSPAKQNPRDYRVKLNRVYVPSDFPNMRKSPRKSQRKKAKPKMSAAKPTTHLSTGLVTQGRCKSKEHQRHRIPDGYRGR